MSLKAKTSARRHSSFFNNHSFLRPKLLMHTISITSNFMASENTVDNVEQLRSQRYERFPVPFMLEMTCNNTSRDRVSLGSSPISGQGHVRRAVLRSIFRIHHSLPPFFFSNETERSRTTTIKVTQSNSLASSPLTIQWLLKVLAENLCFLSRPLRPAQVNPGFCTAMLASSAWTRNGESER